MDRDFWLARWQSNQIAFHQQEINRSLRRFWPDLAVDAAARVFVPLCGKSRDMHWLLRRGHSIIGVELAEQAVVDFFREAGMTPDIHTAEGFTWYRAPDIDLLVGDFFDLTSSLLKDVGGVFDRGALIALPPRMRAQYADHMLRVIPDDVHCLLLALEYDQSRVSGPPHSVPREEVETLYGTRCAIRELKREATDQIPPHFRENGLESVTDTVYHLHKLK